MAVIGVDIGGTKLALALFSGDGAMLKRARAPLAGRAGADVGALILEQVGELLAGAGPVGAIGVAVPGIYHADRRSVWAPNIPGWADYPLAAELERGLGGVRVAVDSDRACAMLGELWRGEAQGCRNAIFLAVGTGIGAGILVDGQVVRGARDIAGAIGWLALDRPYRAEYEACGCFEYHASGPGLARAAREQLLARPGYRGPLAAVEPAALTAEDVFAAADAGDDVAREVLARAIQFWGMAVANLASLFDPEVIIFGGGVFGPAVRLLDEIRAEALRWAQPISMPQVDLRASRLGGEAVLYGAGRLALSASGAAGAAAVAAGPLAGTR